jgi:phage-related protein
MKKRKQLQQISPAQADIEYRVEFVRLRTGAQPFEEFLDSLSMIERAEILAHIEEFRTAKTHGQSFAEALTKFLSDGILELRVRHTSRITRSLFFYVEGKRIIFTSGFIKKTRTTPRSEIEKAQRYRTEFLEQQTSQQP